MNLADTVGVAIRAEGGEAGNFRFDTGERKRQRLYRVRFGAHSIGGYQGYLTGSGTSGTRSLSPMSTGYRTGESLNMLISYEFPNFWRYVVRVSSSVSCASWDLWLVTDVLEPI